MHPKQQIFSVEIPINDEKKMQEFSEAMNEYQNEVVDYIAKLAQELKCSYGCAADVWYLRSRSRWTQEKENELIKLHKQGNPPNILSGEF